MTGDLDPQQASTVAALVAAVHAGELEPVRLLLHPYLHWTTSSGATIRGRDQVIALLGSVSLLDEPDRVEWRDNQIYRWWESAR